MSQVRFLLGPAGSGKTRRCLEEVRATLRDATAGPPLLFLAPKQATYQLERQLLAGPELQGYTRLQIVSFERLARFIVEELGVIPRRWLDEEGRVMVLRALLAERQSELGIFRATARLPGFARELSGELRELQQHRLTPASLRQLAGRVPDDAALGDKLRDLATLLEAYLGWVRDRELVEADGLLETAHALIGGDGASTADGARELRDAAGRDRPRFRLGGLWLDGFAELTPQELELLVAVVRCAPESTLAFCLRGASEHERTWLSTWSTVAPTVRALWNRLESFPELHLELQALPGGDHADRFDTSPVLRALERGWETPDDPAGFGTVSRTGGLGGSASAGLAAPTLPGGPNSDVGGCENAAGAAGDGGRFSKPQLDAALRLVICETREAEAMLAAHEIRRYVRGGPGRRYRDVAVLLRAFEGYHDILSRVFRRYDIPFFLDRRESVAHHPLAELTRYALRTVALGWPPEDWFGALKTGLAPAPEPAIDELENEALSRGWRGGLWAQPLRIPDDPMLERRLERTRRRVIAPFLGLAEALGASDGRVTGSQLAAALAHFWGALGVARRLERWALNHAGAEPGRSVAAVHQTVWNQMHSWLENLALAFAAHALTLGEWLPVVESGLSALSVGVIPPALDQVLIGTVDRSRNPDLQMALVLGLNESVFPAPPATSGLLNEGERDRLEAQGVRLASRTRARLGRERYYGYIACTRARQRLVLACAERSPTGQVLNPSPFLALVHQIFRAQLIERYVPSPDWRESDHVCEVISPAIRLWADPASAAAREALEPWLRRSARWDRVIELATYAPDDVLAPALADALYGPVLRTSVSSLEQFATCPFRFLVLAGLRAKERRRFEIDWRQRGSFQHDVLARFHHDLTREGRSWRDLTPAEARQRVGQAAAAVVEAFGEGLFQASPAGLAEAQQLASWLQDYVEVAVGWLAHCAFEPVAVELGFGGPADPLPAWELALDARHRLAFRGQIDRVDLARIDPNDEALCIVMDYKSGARKLEALLVEQGLQLQLPAYLAALRAVPGVERLFGVRRLLPAGVFYINLRGSYESGTNRQDVLRRAAEAKRRAYRHAGRFNAAYLRHLDQRPNASAGDQFNYRLTPSGAIHGGAQDALQPEAFARLLDNVAGQLRTMGRRIFAGDAAVDPYRRGAEIPCDTCDARTVCRIDPWTHPYRVLRRAAAPTEGENP